MRVMAIDQVKRLVTVEAPAVVVDVIDLVARSGALLEGHFSLQGGSHSPHLFRFAAIGRNPELAPRAAELVSKVALSRAAIAGSGAVTWVAAENAGYLLAEALRRKHGGSVATVKIDHLRRPIQALRAGKIAEGAPVVLVSDVVTTGKSLATLRALATLHGADVRGFVAFAALDEQAFKRLANEHGIAAAHLVSASWKTTPREGCPQCAAAKELLPAAEFN